MFSIFLTGAGLLVLGLFLYILSFVHFYMPIFRDVVLESHSILQLQVHVSGTQMRTQESRLNGCNNAIAMI